MSPVSRAALPCVLLALPACTGDESADPRPATAIVPSDAHYAGELVVRGDAALAADGSVTIQIVPRGGEAPILARSWDLGDPVWQRGAEGWRLYFVLDARDAWPAATGTIVADMDLVARFDPDGNPATDEVGVARTRRPVRTGARDLDVDLTIAPPLAGGEAVLAPGGG